MPLARGLRRLGRLANRAWPVAATDKRGFAIYDEFNVGVILSVIFFFCFFMNCPWPALVCLVRLVVLRGHFDRLVFMSASVYAT